MKFLSFLFIYVFLTVLPVIRSNSICTGNNLFRMVNSDDCRQVWRCRRPGTKPLLMASCPVGTVVGDRFKCVNNGVASSMCQKRDNCGFKRNPCRHGGKCISGTKPKEFDCQCKAPFTGRYCEKVPSPSALCSVFGKFARITDPKLCQSYYDCGDMKSKPILKECHYPLQFDAVSHSCRHYSKVHCGNRKSIKSKCEYTKYKGQTYLCKNVYPSCEGKSDGQQPIKKSSLSPRFMICKDERLVKTGFCPPDKNGPKIATVDGCKSVFEISEKEGGFRPDCRGKRDGYYPLHMGNCRQFFLCKVGKSYVRECPGPLAFDVRNRRCDLKKKICKPCGTKKC